MFLGLALVTIGLLFVVESVFKIDLPILRVLIGVGIVYLGLKVIFGSFGLKISGGVPEKVATATSVIFTEADLQSKSNNEVNRDFQTIFGNSALDLSNLNETELANKIEISAIFGRAEVKTPSNLPLVVESSTAFGSVNVRGDKTSAMGNSIFRSPDFDPNKPHLKLEANAVFGDVQIK